MENQLPLWLRRAVSYSQLRDLYIVAGIPRTAAESLPEMKWLPEEEFEREKSLMSLSTEFAGSTFSEFLTVFCHF